MERRYEYKRRPDRGKAEWGRFYRHLGMAVSGLAISVTVLGVLVTPVIMSLVYTWVWMFLYLVYLIVGLVSWALIRKDGYNEDY